MSTTRVIGIGNPLREDDGVGPAAVARLQSLALPADVEVLDGGEAGLALVGLMEGVHRAVIVDAVRMGARPGEVRVFGLDEVRIAEELHGGGLHAARAGTALQMAEALGSLPPEVRVVGIQPKRTGWGPGLSPEVAAALPRVVDAVLDTVKMEGFA